MKIPYIVLPLVLGGSVAAAAAAPEPNLSTAPPNPIVKMSVTPPDGQTQNLTAPESGMATLTLKDGTEIGVRPTIIDSKPWNHVVVTLFKLPTTSHASEEMGTVDLKTGAAAVASKTSPSLKIAVTGVSAPVHSTT
jgi:hypothetical protein